MKNILILAALSAVILTGCGNISPPFKAEQTTVTTAAPTVSAAASSEAESTVDEEQVKYDTFIAEFFDSNICFSDTSALVTEAMKGCSFETQTDSSNGVQNISLKGKNGWAAITALCSASTQRSSFWAHWASCPLLPVRYCITFPPLASVCAA